MAKQQGAYVVEINPEPTPLTDRVDEFLKGPSGVILPALYQRLITEQQAPQP
jgi:NAD-dependent deacetylase